ncbi:CDP-alcohol phosphatidyltransferase family protein ['Paenibacillus yunnanensis' Narsing Rao et al. 2020]|uniref:CDP-alcohol phosphatidyltransferase family protein n=1 Tax=Paenibacillus tengchongensis TaxID=2608684 RepID=UPI00124C2358|nr:CDP-alcohol phosphatidyltransferase family protein [Paenibacillus tengchongensis]
MTRHIPNLLTLSRIILSVWLLFASEAPLLFAFLYAACGLSDVLDGAIARRKHWESPLGARLDSVADMVFCLAVLVYMIQWLGPAAVHFIPWIIAIAVIRFVNLLIAAIKYRSFAMLHTWGNKLTGAVLFTAPLFLLLNWQVLLWPVCILAVLTAVEETAIHLTSSKLDVNRRSLYTGRR